MEDREKEKESYKELNNFEITDDESCVKRVQLGGQLNWLFKIRVNKKFNFENLIIFDDENHQLTPLIIN
jgi:hypothetical protein